MAKTGSSTGAQRRKAERRVGSAERRQEYRRALGRYDRRITGTTETAVPEEVKKLRAGPAERRGDVARIRRRDLVERRVAGRRQSDGVDKAP